MNVLSSLVTEEGDRLQFHLPARLALFVLAQLAPIFHLLARSPLFPHNFSRCSILMASHRLSLQFRRDMGWENETGPRSVNTSRQPLKPVPAVLGTRQKQKNRRTLFMSGARGSCLNLRLRCCRVWPSFGRRAELHGSRKNARLVE